MKTQFVTSHNLPTKSNEFVDREKEIRDFNGFSKE